MSVAQACNLDMPKFEQDFFDPQTQSTLEDNCARAVKHGAFGTPSLFIDEQLYWGNDRLRLLEHDLLTQHGTDAWQVMGLDHVVLNSPAPEQLANFYIAALGGRLERQFKDFLWQIRFGDCLLDIFRSESMSEEAPLGGVRNMNHFCLRLANFNIDGIAKHLNPMGVEVTLPGEIYGAQGCGPSIYFVDPEGTQVELKGLNLGEQKLYIE